MLSACGSVNNLDRFPTNKDMTCGLQEPLPCQNCCLSSQPRPKFAEEKVMPQCNSRPSSCASALSALASTCCTSSGLRKMMRNIQKWRFTFTQVLIVPLQRSALTTNTHIQFIQSIWTNMPNASLQNEPWKHLRLFGAIACAAMIALPWPNFRVSWLLIHIICVYFLYFLYSHSVRCKTTCVFSEALTVSLVFFVCRKKCMNSRWSVEKQFVLGNGGGNHDMNNLRFACILHVFVHRQFWGRMVRKWYGEVTQRFSSSQSTSFLIGLLTLTWS